MNKTKFIFTLIFFLITIFYCNAQTILHADNSVVKKLIYLDGNGNEYIINKESISYVPVKREMSSSGMYDGGREARRNINAADFKTLIILFDDIIKNTGIHIKERIKTSGVLVRYKNNNVSEKIIISKSAQQKHLEEYLKRILKQ